MSTFTYDPSLSIIQGTKALDTVVVSDSDEVIALTKQNTYQGIFYDTPILASIDIIDINGSGANTLIVDEYTLTLNMGINNALTGQKKSLVVKLGADDTVITVGTWTEISGRVLSDGNYYHVFSSPKASYLYVQNRTPIADVLITPQFSEDATSLSVNMSTVLSLRDPDSSDTSIITKVTFVTSDFPLYLPTLSLNYSGGTLNLQPGQFEFLAAGDVLHLSLNAFVSDGHPGGEIIKPFTVTIQGMNDPAVISLPTPGSDKGQVKEDAILMTSGKLNVTDVDHDQSFFQTLINQQGIFGKFSIDINGNWTYQLDNLSSAVQTLQEGESHDESFTVASLDGTATHTIKITVVGTNDIPVISGADMGQVTEDIAPTTTGKLDITDLDHDQSAFQAANLTGTYGTLNLSTDGNWQYTLNNNSTAVQRLQDQEQHIDTFTVTSLDGTASHAINITVVGTNDIPVISGTDQAQVKEDITLTMTGKLNITDLDHDQSAFQVANLIGTYGTLNLGADGNWQYDLNNNSTAVQRLQGQEHQLDTFTVTSLDETTTHDIKVTVEGTNDVANIFGEDVKNITEDTTSPTFQIVQVNDVDHDESRFISGGTALSPVVHGGLVFTSPLNNSMASFGYFLNTASVQYLHDGESVTDLWQIQSVDGTMHTLTVVIHGSNDPALITGNDHINVTEDNITSASGSLTVMDPDHDESSFIPIEISKFGLFSLDANGSWTYFLTSQAADSIPGGVTETRKLYVTSADGTPHTMILSILGQNDPAEITGDDGGFIDENDAVISTSGSLSVVDPDRGESLMLETILNGHYGSFHIKENGNWIYTLNPNAQTLYQDQQGMDSFTIQSYDGTQKTVAITVQGENDAPTAIAQNQSLFQHQTIEFADARNVLNGAVDIDMGETATLVVSSFGNQSITHETNGLGIDGLYGFLAILDDGTYIYRPYTPSSPPPSGTAEILAEGEQRADVFTYTITDVHGATATSTLTILVKGTGEGDLFTENTDFYSFVMAKDDISNPAAFNNFLGIQPQNLILAADLGTYSPLNLEGGSLGGNDTISLFGLDHESVLTYFNPFNSPIPYFNAGAGNDFIIGSKFDDNLVGGPGDDQLMGMAGNDELEGGVGFDIVRYDDYLYDSSGPLPNGGGFLLNDLRIADFGSSVFDGTYTDVLDSIEAIRVKGVYFDLKSVTDTTHTLFNLISAELHSQLIFDGTNVTAAQFFTGTGTEQDDLLVQRDAFVETFDGRGGFDIAVYSGNWTLGQTLDLGRVDAQTFSITVNDHTDTYRNTEAIQIGSHVYDVAYVPGPTLTAQPGDPGAEGNYFLLGNYLIDVDATTDGDPPDDLAPLVMFTPVSISSDQIVVLPNGGRAGEGGMGGAGQDSFGPILVDKEPFAVWGEDGQDGGKGQDVYEIYTFSSTSDIIVGGNGGVGGDVGPDGPNGLDSTQSDNPLLSSCFPPGLGGVGGAGGAGGDYLYEIAAGGGNDIIFGGDLIITHATNSSMNGSSTYIIDAGDGNDTISVGHGLAKNALGLYQIDGGAGRDILTFEALFGSSSDSYRVNGIEEIHLDNGDTQKDSLEIQTSFLMLNSGKTITIFGTPNLTDAVFIDAPSVIRDSDADQDYNGIHLDAFIASGPGFSTNFLIERGLFEASGFAADHVITLL